MPDRQVYITTADNPYDPHTNFDEWYAYDTRKGYNTSAYLARRAYTSDGISDEDNLIAIEEAIDAICKLNLLGNYRKIVYENGKRIQ